MNLTLLPCLLTTKIAPTLATLIGFEALIAIHELGHFLFCKLFGIGTPTFSIGFGPELFSRKIGDTNFRLALIPFGGYCEIAGHEEVGQGDQAHAHDRSESSFGVKPYWQKLLVMLGGIMCNFLFAYIVACTIFMVGKPVEKPGVYIASVNPGSPAQQAGLQANDRIIELADHSLTESGLTKETARDLVIQELSSRPGQQVKLLIERDGEEKTITATLASKPAGDKMVGSLGVYFGSFNYSIPQLPFFQAIKAGVKQTNAWIGMIVQALTTLITRRKLESVGGPVMMFSQIFSSAQNGLLSLFVLLALISTNLALFNLLPIGALDGGQVLFITIEAVVRRKIPETVKIGINLASWAFFIILTLILTYRDLLAIFTR